MGDAALRVMMVGRFSILDDDASTQYEPAFTEMDGVILVPIGAPGALGEAMSEGAKRALQHAGSMLGEVVSLAPIPTAPSGGDVNSTDLLALAGRFTTAQIDKMAHALGWPSVATMAGRGGGIGRVKWSNPWRNNYLGSAEDGDWTAAENAGLAERSVPPFEVAGDTYWQVTRLGQAVVRLRLQAARLAGLENKAAKKDRGAAAAGPPGGA